MVAPRPGRLALSVESFVAQTGLSSAVLGARVQAADCGTASVPRAKIFWNLLLDWLTRHVDGCDGTRGK